MTEKEEIRVLVTGFAPWKGLPTNESWEIASRLPRYIPETFACPVIRVIVPPNPIQVSYRSILTQVPLLLKEHNPDIVVHMGLDEGRTFFGIEQSAAREGYHQNLDIDRKVFTKAETKKLWGKAPERLATNLDLEETQVRWKRALEGGKGKDKAEVDVRTSDDVGDFVCGFIYYVTLREMAKRRDAVFLHVPPLKTASAINNGVDVTMAFLKALVEVWRETIEC